MRLFAAAWPPAGVRRSLARLPRPDVPGLRWTTTDQWHVTLAFYGEVPEEELPALAGPLGRAAMSVPGPPVATVGDRTLLLGRDALCLPVSGLDLLAGTVREATLPWVRNGPGFTGHLSLARAGRGREVPACLVDVPLPAGGGGGSRGRGAPAVSWAVEEVCLAVSTASPDGSRYRIATSAPVGPGGAP